MLKKLSKSMINIKILKFEEGKLQAKFVSREYPRHNIYPKFKKIKGNQTRPENFNIFF